MTIIEIHKSLLDFEIDLDLFNVTVNNVRFWERIRLPVFYAIALQSTIDMNSQSGNARKFSKLKRLISSIFMLRKNALLSPRNRILFVCASRRLLEKDELWWDIYTDPIIDNLDVPPLSVERHYKNSHYEPAKTPGLRYLDFIELLIFLKKRLRIARISFTKKESNLLQQIRKGILRRFGVSLDIESLTRGILEERKASLPLYIRLLRRVRPDVVVHSQGYGWENFIEASKSLGIPSVELQHGTISPFHFGYSFAGESRNKETFADYLLVFGDYWKSCTEYPIHKDRVVSVGFPYLDNKKNLYLKSVKKKQILFTSQEPTGAVLSKFALKLSQVKDTDYAILYKLHPRECDGWEDKYPWLLRSDVKVIDKQEAVLYDLFAESIAHVGVYSTSLYEGLAFGLQTYVIDAPGVEYMDPLLETGLVHKVSSVEELLRNIERRKSAEAFDAEYFFKTNAAANISRFLNELIQRVKNNDADSSPGKSPERQTGARPRP